MAATVARRCLVPQASSGRPSAGRSTERGQQRANMGSAAHQVEVYYDVVSPFSLLGFETVIRYQDAWNLRVTFQPMFLGGVMQATGNKPPAMLPARALYLTKDLERLSRYHGVPLRYPSTFPVLTVLPMRVLTLIAREEGAAFATKAESEQSLLVRASRSFWKSFWQEDRDISKPNVILSALIYAGLSEGKASELLSAASGVEVKAALKQATANAVACGAYGAPTLFVTKAGREESEMYFGSDRFHLIAQQLGTQWNGAFPSMASRL